MNLYLIWQNVNRGYDTYDSAVVVAKNEEEAKLIHPKTYADMTYIKDKGWFMDDYLSDGNYDWPDRTWANNPEEVKVQLLGKAVTGLETVVCASFNAG